MKTRLSKGFLLLIGAVLLLASSSANAETIRVTQNSDYWFTFEEPTQFTARTHYIEGIGSDPHLWFYNADNELITANDDWFGLQSYISAQVQPGVYRLRAGVCCGDPNRWWQGVEYDLEASQTAVTTTSESSTTTSTTLPPTTTSVPPTTTTSTSTTTTTTSTVPPTTTTEPPTTTTTVQLETTTSSVAPTVPPSTSTIPPTTSSSTSTTTTSSTSTTSTSTTTTTVVQTTTTVEVTPEPTPEQAAAIATNPEQVAELSSTEAEAVFAALDVDTLTQDELIELVAAVQDAPAEVREAFEQEVDIFSGATDTYVPLGSTVPVGTRRTLIVVTTITAVVAFGATRRW